MSSPRAAPVPERRRQHPCAAGGGLAPHTRQRPALTKTPPGRASCDALPSVRSRVPRGATV